MTGINFISGGKDRSLKHGRAELVDRAREIYAHWFHPAHLRDNIPVDTQIKGHEAILLISDGNESLLSRHILTEGESTLVEGVGKFRHNPVETRVPGGAERRR